MRHDELIQRGAGPHEDGERQVAPPPSPPHLLPGAGDRAGVSHQDRRRELADIDAELEGVRRRDGAHRAAAQARLDPPPLAREIPGPVPGDRPGVPPAPAGVLLQIRGQQFRAEARARKEDRLHAAGQQLAREGHRFPHGVAPDAEGLVHDRGVVETDHPRTRRRSAPVDHGDRPADQPLGVLPRVPDRRGAADELRGAPVELADPQQPADHVGEVRAEHAPVVMEFVEDDVPEVLEEAEPLRVMRKDRRVQHVRVRDHDVAGRADRPPGIGGRVAVVRGGPHIHAERADQPVELVYLIARQRLGREQVQRPRVVLFEDGVENRQVIAEGFP